jgi:hypothetical protein
VKDAYREIISKFFEINLAIILIIFET